MGRHHADRKEDKPAHKTLQMKINRGQSGHPEPLQIPGGTGFTNASSAPFQPDRTPIRSQFQPTPRSARSPDQSGRQRRITRDATHTAASIAHADRLGARYETWPPAITQAAHQQSQELRALWSYVARRGHVSHGHPDVAHKRPGSPDRAGRR